MKAIVFTKFGGPEVLHLEDLPTPKPAANEILLKIPDVDKALQAAATGKIRAIIDRTLPLSEAVEAHRILEKNQTLGKIILDPTRN